MQCSRRIVCLSPWLHRKTVSMCGRLYECSQYNYDCFEGKVFRHKCRVKMAVLTKIASWSFHKVQSLTDPLVKTLWQKLVLMKLVKKFHWSCLAELAFRATLCREIAVSQTMFFIRSRIDLKTGRLESAQTWGNCSTIPIVSVRLLESPYKCFYALKSTKRMYIRGIHGKTSDRKYQIWLDMANWETEREKRRDREQREKSERTAAV